MVVVCRGYPRLRDLDATERLEALDEHMKICDTCRESVKGFQNGSLRAEIVQRVKRMTRGSAIQAMTIKAFGNWLETLSESDQRALLLSFKHRPHAKPKEDYHHHVFMTA